MHQWRVVKRCFKSRSNFWDCKLKLLSLPTKFSSNLNDWTPRYNLSNYIGYSLTLYYLLLVYMYLFILWYNLSTKFTAKSSGKVLYLWTILFLRYIRDNKDFSNLVTRLPLLIQTTISMNMNHVFDFNISFVNK